MSNHKQSFQRRIRFYRENETGNLKAYFTCHLDSDGGRDLSSVSDREYAKTGFSEIIIPSSTILVESESGYLDHEEMEAFQDLVDLNKNI